MSNDNFLSRFANSTFHCNLFMNLLKSLALALMDDSVGDYFSIWGLIFMPIAKNKFYFNAVYSR